MTDYIAIAHECGAIGYMPWPLREVQGVSFTFEQFADFVKKEYAKWGDVIRRSGARID